MKKRMLALALAAAMMVGVLTSCSNGGSTSGGTSGNSSDGALNITWGAGTLGGTIQLLSTACASVIQDKIPGSTVTVQATGGSIENCRLLVVNVISTAAELGYLNVPENTLIELDQMKNYPDEQMVLITTGSQGESMAALSRMASNMHRKVQIKPGDTVIFSSNPIPGNEKAVSRVINELSMKGADVIFQDAHVSGHACQEEIKLIYSLVHPKYAIPVHGEYRHLKAQAQVAESLGIPKDNIFLLSSGDVLELDEEKAQVVDRVQTGAILVDGLGVGDVGNIVLRDRQHLAEDGILIVVLTLEKYSNQVLAGPDIVSRGFVYG